MTVYLSNPAVEPALGIDLFPSAAEEPHVSPATKTTDVSRISLTAPMVFALLASVVTIVGAFWSIKNSDDRVTLSIQSEVRNIQTSMAYEAKINEQRFLALDAKVESASLRQAALSMAQELAKQKGR